MSAKEDGAFACVARVGVFFEIGTNLRRMIQAVLVVLLVLLATLGTFVPLDAKAQEQQGITQEQICLYFNSISAGGLLPIPLPPGCESIVGQAVTQIGGGLLLETVSTIVWILAQILVWIMYFILSIIGAFFDFIVTDFVIGMGKYVTAENAYAVRAAWTIIRDLCNIAIIGGLVATAIGTIIGSGSYSIQKNLARLILAALLVNFSYFVAGAIVDFSNFTARAAYQYVLCPPAQGQYCGVATRIAKVTDLASLGAAINPVGGALTNAIGFATQGSSLTEEQRQNIFKIRAPSTHAAHNVMLLIFICVTTFVFLSAVSLLVARFVSLIFLIITSPVGIAGMSVPFLEKYAKDWWKEMGSQALFAPVYFLLAGISLNILDQMKYALYEYGVRGVTQSEFPLSLNSGLQNIVSVVVMFTVAIGFMIVALSTAKSMSKSERFKDIYGATEKAFGWMPKAYQSAVMTIPKTAAFGLGVGIRELVGKGAYYAAIKYRKFAGTNNLQDSESPLVRALDRVMKKNLDTVANQKFLGAKGYHDLHEEIKARGIELGDVEKEETQKGLLEGKLIGKKKKRFEELDKKTKDALTATQQARWKELKGKEAKGTLTDAEKAELATLNDLKKAALTTDAEKADWDDLNKITANGGVLGRIKAAQDKRDREFMKADRLRGETDEQYAARQAGRGRWGVQGRLVDDPNNPGRKIWKEEEDLPAYFERLEAEEGLTGLKKVREEGEAIEATIPEGFEHRIYDENPKELVKYAPLFTPEKHLALMKDPKISRKIKNQMRAERRGTFGRMVNDLHEKIRRGEILDGGEEYGRQTGVSYYYMLKQMNNPEEFSDLVTSEAEFDTGQVDANGNRVMRKFEDLRKMDNLINGGSLTGAFLNLRDKLSPGERRAQNARKRKAYLIPQKIVDGFSLAAGREGYDESGVPTDNHWLPRMGGSDRAFMADEAIALAQDWTKPDGNVQMVLRNANATAADKELAAKRDRFARLVLAAADPANRNKANAGTQFFPAGIDEHERERRIHAARTAVLDAKKIENAQERKRVLAELTDAGRADGNGNLNFAVQMSIEEGEEGMGGFFGGKNVQDELKLMSMERSISRATVMGSNPQIVTTAMKPWDSRQRLRIRDNVYSMWPVEKIAALVGTDADLASIGGYLESAAEVEAANKIRRLEFGLAEDDHSQDLPVAMTDLLNLSSSQISGGGGSGGGGGGGGGGPRRGPRGKIIGGGGAAAAANYGGYSDVGIDEALRNLESYVRGRNAAIAAQVRAAQEKIAAAQTLSRADIDIEALHDALDDEQIAIEKALAEAARRAGDDAARKVQLKQQRALQAREAALAEQRRMVEEINGYIEPDPEGFDF